MTLPTKIKRVLLDPDPRLKLPKARLHGEFTTAAIEKLVEAVLEEHYR